MAFKDFLSKQPIHIIVNTEVTDEKVILPTLVDSKSFYKSFSNEIESETLTIEKAVYIASTEKSSSMDTSKDLLNSKLSFT